jgi:pimeloyl-ACP methyl ester carboxylesterase
LAGGYELLEPLAGFLSRHFRVLSYQLRGEDDCFALRRPFGLRDLAEDLHEFLDCLALELPVVMGVSFGGTLALEFAARHPHRLQALLLQGVGASFEPGLLQQVAGQVLSRCLLPADSPFLNQFFNLFFGCRVGPGPLFDFVTRQCWQTDQSVMAHRFRLAEQFDIRPRLSRITVPTLVLAGQRDLLVSAESLRELCAGLPRATLERLPGCGHLAFVMHPDRVAGAVHRFVQDNPVPAAP